MRAAHGCYRGAELSLKEKNGNGIVSKEESIKKHGCRATEELMVGRFIFFVIGVLQRS